MFGSIIQRGKFSSGLGQCNNGVRAYSTVQVPTQSTVIRYKKFGYAPNVLKAQKEDIPALAPNGVLLKMIYAPINPVDLDTISGSYPHVPTLPGIGGNEGVAKVLQVGPKTTKVKVGDLVLPSAFGFGTWRDYASCDESQVIAVPKVKDVKLEYLATLSIAPATAFRLLNDFVDLKEGDVIIQNGANGMVGLSVVQLAAARGIKTINVIRRRSDYEELVELIKSYGGYLVCGDDYIRTPEFRGIISDLPKPKLALSCASTSSTELARLLSPGGTLVTYGGMSSKPITLPTSSFIFNDITCKGFWINKWYETQGVEKKQALLEHLVELVENKKLRLWVERHPFAEFDTALYRAIRTTERSRKVLISF
eukprot:TRINITY_DN1242_c0_g1_i1.p1 TRINITY_DN1242_c0_g1~~TRINITY_DN1242_c0_g1_i1.p1  ORF type:complete len:366 (-),score=59.73 TRINITY_DN1242_c0_g1_i1:58-1155(-)